MLEKVRVGLRPRVSRLNLPTVIKTTILPGDQEEKLIVATQVGEIFYFGNGTMGTLLDIRPLILRLGASGGRYDERGLLGLAIHPDFYYNGLFYIHYSVAGTQGPGALSGRFTPNPCDPDTLSLQWTNREAQYDHIDTVEEWIIQPSGQVHRTRVLLNLRRPFFNHNGVNSLTFSPESGRLVLTTGDGGLGYDPFNLSQNDMEIAGKIIEIDIARNAFPDNPPVVTRFSELPAPVQEALTIIVKGVRNIPGISYQSSNSHYIKYVGNVGQDLVEAIYSFEQYRPIPVTDVVATSNANTQLDLDGLINLGWRGWEGILPTPVIRSCPGDGMLNEKTIAYYEDAIRTSTLRLPPLTCYYHQDPRPGKFEGKALTGVQAYMGREIPGLTGSLVFTDFVKGENAPLPPRGTLAYTRLRPECRLSDYSIIDIDYNFGEQPAYYTSLGTNQDQTRLFLGVYGSMNVTDLNQGTVYEIIRV
jgi:hypothetical protein